ncbi:MAG: hybrid sensor histidine kinase/response regulator [Desertifilum sp. SIO1I2]|nr:hybrid sensor histidine kinase/response regulator [Desertifilum sp. SIO1I2]
MIRILVIEDEDAIRENLIDLLEISNFEALSADNGKTGLELATQLCPDLILCDVMMPEMDGYEVLAHLRSHPHTATIPFIFLSAKADRPDLRQGMNLGADDYLTKPYTPDEILGAIASRLEKHQQVQNNLQTKLNELRSNIAYSLPHEFRTPLNSILGFSELLVRHPEKLNPTDIQEMADGIHRAGQRLYRLIQNFLLYTDLELVLSSPESVTQWRQQTTPYSQVIIQNASIRQAQAANREQDLELNLIETDVPLSATSLQKIVEELTNNAFKFSKAGTPVKVSSQIGPSTFKLAVSDRGRGMSREQVANLGAYMQFERDYYEQQGSGLGLAIVKRLVELHQGRLKIESIPQQQTLVQVIIPLLSPTPNGDRDLEP